MPDADPLHEEFLAVLRGSGLQLDPERLPVLFAAAREVRAWSDTMRRWDSPPSAEAANVYSVAAIARAGEAPR